MACSKLTSLRLLHRKTWLRNSVSVQQNRGFLSESFNLKTEWNDRLKATLFSKIDMDQYFIDIDRQYARTKSVSHIDLDIFANAVLLSKTEGTVSASQDLETRFEQMEELLRRFRNTPETIKLLDSTSHAVVRGYLDGAFTDSLMRILNDRLKFGLILDDYTNILLLNHYLQNGNLRDAAKSAILMMLQEEYDVPIAKEMAMYATYKYILSLKNVTEESEPWNPQPEPVVPEPEDEVLVRVAEVENPDFDDHFDLEKREHLLGKTLLKFAQNDPNLSNPDLKNSLRLLGSVFFEKWSIVDEICHEKSGKCGN